jgi:hypothetical protein
LSLINAEVSAAEVFPGAHKKGARLAYLLLAGESWMVIMKRA